MLDALDGTRVVLAKAAPEKGAALALLLVSLCAGL